MKVLLAHGSTASEHGEQLAVLAGNVSKLLGEEIGTACLDDQVLPEGATVLPLFLGEGKHVREDVPELVAASGGRLLPVLADSSDQIAELVVQDLTRETRRIHALFVLYRFSGFEQLAAALYGKAKVCSKHALASLHSEPSLAAVLQHWQLEGVKQVTLQPVLLFKGHSLSRCKSMLDDSTLEIRRASVLSELDGFPSLIAELLKAGDAVGKEA